VRKHGKMTIRMAYEMVMPYHLHMPSYFLETFTEYPFLKEGRRETFFCRECGLVIRFILKIFYSDS